jgi:anti-anti-sigma factor
VPPAGGRPSPGGEPLLTVTITHHETADVVSVTGDIDASTVGKLETTVTEVLSATRPTRRIVVIDLDRVQFLAAAGLHMLDSAHQRCGENLELRLVTTSETIMRVLDLFYLDHPQLLHLGHQCWCYPGMFTRP